MKNFRKCAKGVLYPWYHVKRSTHYVCKGGTNHKQNLYCPQRFVCKGCPFLSLQPNILPKQPSLMSFVNTAKVIKLPQTNKKNVTKSIQNIKKVTICTLICNRLHTLPSQLTNI